MCLQTLGRHRKGRCRVSQKPMRLTAADTLQLGAQEPKKGHTALISKDSKNLNALSFESNAKVGKRLAETSTMRSMCLKVFYGQMFLASVLAAWSGKHHPQASHKINQTTKRRVPSRCSEDSCGCADHDPHHPRVSLSQHTYVHESIAAHLAPKPGKTCFLHHQKLEKRGFLQVKPRTWAAIAHLLSPFLPLFFDI